MRPSEAFEICYDRYVACRERLEKKVSAINPMASAEDHSRPYRSSLMADYVADFDRCA